MLQPGDQVDRYAVLAELGVGATATVYRVQHVILHTEHALKVLRSDRPAVRARAIQEARFQASLRHDHVVAVTDVIEVEGAPGLVMDLADGPDLEAWLAEHRPGLAEAEAIFRQIVLGIQAAHAVGCVHRDLKPANVLLTQQGGRLLARVSDFGLASRVLREPDTPRMTQEGALLGTPAYMAPEQARDARGADERADIFSLGCILYYLVCGQPPFGGDDLYRILLAAADRGYDPPRSHAPELPDRVVAAIEGALDPDPATRLPDCAALLAVLGGATGPLHPPTLDASAPPAPLPAAPPPATPLPVAPPAPLPRRPPLVLGLIGGLGLLGATAALLWWAWPPTTPTSPTVDTPPPALQAASVPAAAPPVEATPPAIQAPAPAPPSSPRVEARTAAAAAAPSSPSKTDEPTPATVQARGGATEVWLERAGRRAELGRVAPGRYEIYATFDGSAPIHAGDVSVSAGATITLTCDAVFQQCRP